MHHADDCCWGKRNMPLSLDERGFGCVGHEAKSAAKGCGYE